MSRHDHHRPCPCGAALADECPRCAATNPLGSMRIDPRDDYWWNQRVNDARFAEAQRAERGDR